MPQIIPIKELKNTSEISELCHKTEGPIFITKNGYGDMAIMSMEIYENMIRQLVMYQDLELSAGQAEERQVRDARKSLAEMRAKYGI
ncbi:MAG: type II toxin-antitoxin system Phd/YefM family antitoxin [Lachnospiraceae bacterium]|jgi:PHD/YefM family antitoxin component YafN of YafNO toxin-antitoxin module|nr:type II toxin-antitoxin system Phd/YefM family antitoxin [Lachnospiraceae bacterium]